MVKVKLTGKELAKWKKEQPMHEKLYKIQKKKEAEKKERKKKLSAAKSKAIRKMQTASRKRLHKISIRKIIPEKRLKLTKGKYEKNLFLRPLET